MIYCWKKGAHHPAGVSAQEVGGELERIRTFNNGRLENHDVVEAARPEGSPLHRAFEWDDTKAAEAYRIDQAGDLIRAVNVVIEHQGEAKEPIRAFVSVAREEDRSYTSVQHALSDAGLRLQVVRAAWAELEAWRKRHAELVEFAAVFATIEQARAA